MHGHSYAILFLSQVIGQVPTPQREEQIRKVIRSGVKLILSCQTKLGGWGYDPSDPLDEASLTVCCLQALRSAKEAGVNVPKGTIDRALEYLRKCATEDGTFRYSLTRSKTELLMRLPQPLSQRWMLLGNILLRSESVEWITFVV